jgi:hypothetical protein
MSNPDTRHRQSADRRLATRSACISNKPTPATHSPCARRRARQRNDDMPKALVISLKLLLRLHRSVRLVISQVHEQATF